MTRDPVPVHPDPRPDHQHGGAGSPDHIGEHGADEQEKHVDGRGRLAFDADMDAAGHYKEGADQRKKAEVFDGRMEHRLRFPQDEQVIEERDRTESRCDPMIELFPGVLEGERRNRDRQQQQSEWNEHQRMGFRVHRREGLEEEIQKKRGRRAQ